MRISTFALTRKNQEKTKFFDRELAGYHLMIEY